MDERLALCEYQKSGRRVQLSERNDMKNLMDRVELIANQLISENNFSLRKLQDRFQGKKDDDSTIYNHVGLIHPIQDQRRQGWLRSL